MLSQLARRYNRLDPEASDALTLKGVNAEKRHETGARKNGGDSGQQTVVVFISP
jgi:hypothetical protein